MAKRGRPNKPIEVPDHVCPSCGITITGVKIRKVIDTPAQSADYHWEVEANGVKGEGALFDAQRKVAVEAEVSPPEPKGDSE
jgi:hypothetical protein